MIQTVVMANCVIVVMFLSTLNICIPQTASQRNVSSKPDLSGIWNARIVQDRGQPTTSLRISYQDPKLKISRISRSNTPVIVLGQMIPSGYSVDFLYYTDGRGETNRSLFQLGPITSGDVKSTTERTGQTFVITSSFNSKKSGRQVRTDITYTLEVSSDGDTLSLSTIIVADGVSQQIEESYDRIEGPKSSDINGRWAKKLDDSIVSLIILHHDPEIKVTRRVLSQGREQIENYTYYSDGRGETNLENGKPVKSITKWDGNSLVIAVSYLSRVGDDNIDFRRSVRWQMSSDRRSLTETTKSRSRATVGMITPDSLETKLVFALSANQYPRQ